MELRVLPHFALLSSPFTLVDAASAAARCCASAAGQKKFSKGLLAAGHGCIWVDTCAWVLPETPTINPHPYPSVSLSRSNHEIEQQADAQATIFAAYQARLKVRAAPCGPSGGHQEGNSITRKRHYECTAGMLAPTALPVLPNTSALLLPCPHGTCMLSLDSASSLLTCLLPLQLPRACFALSSMRDNSINSRWSAAQNPHAASGSRSFHYYSFNFGCAAASLGMHLNCELVGFQATAR